MPVLTDIWHRSLWCSDMTHGDLGERASAGPPPGRPPTTVCGAARLILDAMVQRRPFPLLAERPASLDGVILDFHWDLERLHALSLPEREVSTSTLEWHLHLPFWAAGGRPFQVSPADVASEPSAHPEQWTRTLAADLRYPLDAYVEAEGRLII